MRKINGRQQDWQAIKKTTDKPIITIITSTFKAKETLHWTYESIKNQTYPYIQWIIADGASNDGTVELLELYSDVIDVWFSEPDTGICDAWNKALDYVQGDWVQFLGAGDELYEKDTLEKASVYLKDAYPEYESVYGQVLHVSEKKRQELFITGKPWESYINKLNTLPPTLPIHPGVFQHQSMFKKYGNFDTRYQIIADNLLLLQSARNKPMKFIPQIIDIMPIGGLTGRIDSEFVIIDEVKRAVKEYNIQAPLTHRIGIFFKLLFKKIIIAIFKEEKTKIVFDKIRLLLGKSKVWTIDE